MATKTLSQKLYIRPGYTVALLNAPKGMADILTPLPDEVKVVTSTKEKANLALIFVKSSAELEKAAKSLKETVDGKTVLWFAYPKLSSKTASDLSRDHGWKILNDMGYEGVAAVAIDDVWSGLRFKRAAIRGDEELIDKQYAGARAEFRPLYDQIVTIARSLGDDVEMSIRQTYVAFSRGKQFALAKPSADRLDLVLKLPTFLLGSRLIKAPGVGSGAMNYRVALTKVTDIDREVVSWLQDAYRLAGK